MREYQKLMEVTKKLKEIYPEMTIKQLHIFLTVYNDEGYTQFHYGKKCGESEAVVSRTVSRFGMEKLPKNDQLELIKTGIAADNRSKALLISDKGKELVKSLLETLKD